ncbi:MAG: CehA/McbA family metallohydrolase [Myxococcaceae bacterium]
MPRPLARSPFSLLVVLVSAAVFFSACKGCGGDPGDGGGGAGGGSGGGDPNVTSDRCELPLDRFAVGVGNGASAKQVASETDLIGGPNAYGKSGDYLLQNDQVRFIIQGIDRHIGPQPFGATILDADLQHSGPGNDQFGEIGLLYNFGRTVDPTKFEILSDGSAGGAAILAATGLDSANDYLSIRNQLQNQLGSVPKSDPYKDVPLKITNYFVLNPGEKRLRFVTAFCNTSGESTSLAVGDLTDPGYSLDFFNGQSCTNGFGFGGLCFGLDRMSWYGYQGDGVAYGYAPWDPHAPLQPGPVNALLTVSGVTGSVLGAPGITGVAAWFGDGGMPSSAVTVPGNDSRYFARDFFVGKDLGELATMIETSRAEVAGGTIGSFSGTVTDNGAPLPNARVTFLTTDGLSGVWITDAAGHFQGALSAKSYTVSAWADGRLPSASKTVQLTAAAPQTITFDLTGTRTLTVNVTDAASGGPMPAKVTVLCQSGTCTAPDYTLNIYTDTVHDPLLGSMRAVSYVPPSGTVQIALPPGQYEVLVSRGPEYSIFPNTYPTTTGYPVDLRTSDAAVSAPLFHVIDTTGYMSADFHVHAVNSPDSPVVNDDRVKVFMGDGIDVIVSTDHDYITDFQPIIDKLNAGPFIATVIGEEVSTMDFGHYNLFPLNPDRSDVITGGAVDWAGGRGATLNPKMIFAAGRALGAKTVHFNHPRGFLGGFTHLLVDTDTLATHADPASFRMDTPAGASAADTLLLNTDFNALEVLNSGEDEFDITQAKGRINDWFTLLSRGIKVAATGVSDTHRKRVGSGYRTWVGVGVDSTAAFDPTVMSDRLNNLRAVAGDAPFVKIDARRVNSSGQATSAPVGMGEVVPKSTDNVLVTVDVQVPEYLDITRIELYSHKPQDDDRCPRDPASVNAPTTRVACNGEMNLNWPSSGITAFADITLGSADLETVNTIGGTAYRRWHITKTFTLPAPTKDNWVSAFVYGSKSLFPLIYRPVAPGKPNINIVPFALTNPIFIDADGNGYDKFPFAPPPPPPQATVNTQPPRFLQRPPFQSESEFVQRWGEWVSAQ